MQFEIPKSKTVHEKVLSDFLGADFTSVYADRRRASDMLNVINNHGQIETRPGYVQVGNTIEDGGTAQNINGVWNVDRTDDSVMVVHAGTKLYVTTSSFSSLTTVMTGLTDKISVGLYLNGYLLIFDGTRAIVYGEFSSTWGAHYLDTKGTVPTVVVGTAPDGTGGTTVDAINLVNPARMQSFLSDDVSTSYQLNETNLDATTPIVTQLQADGSWAAVTAFTYTASTGIVLFNSAPGSSPVDGQDNIRIIYYKTDSSLTDHINKATIATLFGYEGNNNRLFVTGEPDYEHVDWYSDANDPLYFPADNFGSIGSQPIVGYSILNNGKLAVLKDISDSDYTIYYRASYLYDGEETFPIEYGVRSVGTISSYSADNLLNDPLILTTDGVCGLVSDARYDYAKQRSYYLNSKLQAESNLENATGIAFQDKYYLAVNDHVYVLDSRYKIKIKDSTSNFQYEGYYWENVPVRVWFQLDNKLYFGTDDGKIAKLDNTICYDYTTDSPINCYFISSPFDGGNINVSKTVKQITVISKPNVPTTYSLSYITDDEETLVSTTTYSTDNFSKTLVEKEKIKGFNFVQFKISNNTTNKMSFYAIGLKYIFSGRYRGE